jgi:ABC-type branched-subunit amino acid transport system ATPase component/ABC-type branched-subunit amino acid transport system permease subunit
VTVTAQRPFIADLAVILALAAAYLVVVALVQNQYYQLMMTLVPIWAVMGLSWNALSGYTGLVSFGHASFFGLGAYAVTLAFVHAGITPWIGIPFAAVVGALAGLLIGFPTFRLRGHYFALAMLAYPLALLYVFEWLGYQEVTLPMQRERPAAYMQFADHRVYSAIAVALLVVCMIGLRLVERSRFGMSLLAIKQNELAAESVGIDTWRWKLRAITLSGAIAGAAGGLYAVILLVVTPASVFGMLTSAQALIVALFGGVGTIWGAVIGAAVLIPLSEILHAELGNVIPGIQGVVFGVAIIVVILLAPEGIYWKVRDRLHARAPRAAGVPHRQDMPAASDSRPANAPAPGETILQVRGLSKSFGGLNAVQDVSFSIKAGEIVGIIGPNGAGKTTLFNLLTGLLPADRGEALWRGKSIIGLPSNRICRLGVGRTFQVVRPFPRMTVLDNVVVGAFCATRDDKEARSIALRTVARVGLADYADAVVGGLPSKHLRLMELARALAGRPQMLLLDETLAGLGGQETEEVLTVLRRLAAGGITIVIIEHTMHAMVRLVGRFIVLDHGAVIAEGTPAAITRDAAVIEAYLGKKWRAHA